MAAGVIGVGDNTVDLYLSAGLQFPGGNAVNVPVLAARLGARASYIGCVGDDAAGRLILDSLKEEGVDVSRCRKVKGGTAWSRILHEGNDRRFAGSSPGVRAAYELEPADLALIAAHDLTHTSIYSDLEPRLAQLKEAARLLSFDFSEDWDDAYLDATLPHVDIAFLSHPDRTDAACRELMERVAARGPRLVVVTRGLDGSMAYDGHAHYRQPMLPAEAVDTLGAGDAFIAAFLVAQLAGEGLAASLRAGAAYAARACAHQGAFGHGRPIEPGQPGAVTELARDA